MMQTTLRTFALLSALTRLANPMIVAPRNGSGRRADYLFDLIGLDVNLYGDLKHEEDHRWTALAAPSSRSCIKPA
jgi:hypothetical protein